MSTEDLYRHEAEIFDVNEALRPYDAIVPLSYELNLDCSLKEDLKNRMDKAIELFFNSYGSALATNGRHGKNYPNSPITLAEAMKDYAIQQGVPYCNIHKEEKSLDTVGNAFFIKKEVAVPNKMKSMIVVSSNYHIERVREIFDFVFADGYKLGYVGATSMLDGNMEVTKKEKRSLQAFRNTFEGVKAGDDEAIEERLFSSHILYKR